MGIINKQVLITLCLCTSLASCAVGPDFHAPKAPTTPKYLHGKPPKRTVASQGAAGISQRFVEARQIPKQWWKIYQSPTLNQLIEEGLHQSPDIAAAKARLTVAEETLKAQIGTLLWPSANLNLGAQRSKIVTIQYGVNTPGNIFSLYNVVASGTYNLDVFGGARRQVEYYCSQVDYQKFQLLATNLTISSNIVSTAIAIASLHEQIYTTEQLIQTQQALLRTIQGKHALGGASQEEVAQQQTQVARTQATLPPLKKSLVEQQHALAVLTGRYTSESPDLHLLLNELHLPKQLPVTLPSSLVRQRPDILAAEAVLHGASANIGVATANLLPQFNIAADFGWIADQPSTLFIPLSNTWDYGMALMQPLFRGGALLAQRRAAKAAFEQRYAEYQRVVLDAFRNVANALRAIQIDAEEYRDQTIAEEAAKQSYTITKGRYTLGGQDYLALLNSQQQFLETKLEAIKARALRYSDTAALFYALGGGWWPEPEQDKGAKA